MFDDPRVKIMTSGYFRCLVQVPSLLAFPVDRGHPRDLRDGGDQLGHHFPGAHKWAQPPQPIRQTHISDQIVHVSHYIPLYPTISYDIPICSHIVAYIPMHIPIDSSPKWEFYPPIGPISSAVKARLRSVRSYEAMSSQPRNRQMAEGTGSGTHWAFHPPKMGFNMI